MSADTYRCGRCGMTFRILEKREWQREWTSCADCKLRFASGDSTNSLIRCHVTRADADWREGKAVAR